MTASLIENGRIFNARNQSTTLEIVAFSFTTVGFVLFIAGLILLTMTAVLFAEWRQKYKNQVLFQFMTARFLSVLIRFVFDASLIFGFYHRGSFLSHYDQMLHVYSDLALVAWMFVFAKTMYESLVIVMIVPSNYRLLKTSLFSWVTPLVAAILVSVVPFVLHGLELYMYLLYFFFLKWPLLFWNCVLLVKILFTLKSKNRTLCHNRPENNAKIVVTMVFLIFIFSFQQIIHDIYKIIYLVLYHKFNEVSYFIQAWIHVINIAALYYCTVSIAFWLIYNQTTRDLWKDFIKKKLRL